jgi:PAS domain S-box-containing protein
MKNEMDRLRSQVEELKAEVLRLQQKPRSSQQKISIPQSANGLLAPEKALVDSDERYQSLFETMLNGFAYCRMLFEDGLPKDFIYLKVNKAFETLTGLKNVEGKKVSEAIPGIQESDPEVIEIYGRVVLTGKPEKFEIYVNALSAWFQVSVYSPQKEYFVAVFDVITERKLTETALHESEERFRMLVESAPIGIFTTSSSGKPLTINLAMARILDFASPEEALERYTDLSGQLYVHAERREVFLRLIRDFGHVEDFEYQARTATSRIIWLSMNARVSERREDGSFIIEGFATDITERKRAEDALHESEEIFNSFMEHCPVYVFFKDETIRPIRLSRNYEKLLGRPIKDILGKTMNELFPPDLAKGMIEDDLSVMRGGKPIKVVEQFDDRFFETTKFPILQPGKHNLLAGFTIDITDRKRAEDALREGDERYRQIVESSSDAILVRSGEAIIYANPAALRLFRAGNIKELVGKRYLDLVHPDDRTESIERIKKGNNEKWIAPPREHRILALDGQTVHVESTGVPVQNRGETQIFGVFRDITVRKQVDEKLRETEKKYRELAESLSQVIFEVDSNGHLIYLNQTGFTLFGYTPEDLAKGFNVLEAFIPEDRERVALDIMLNIQGQRLGRQDYTAVRKDGTKFPAGVHASRVMSGQTATGVKGILIDLTATQQAEEDKKKLEMQLQQAQKMEAIGALAGGIAHDFNNILSAIIGYTELAKLNEGASVSENELNQALIAANRAKELVKQILAFSRQTDDERMPVKVGMVVKEAIKFLRATIPATIDIKTRIDEKSGAVLANSVELHQIIMNLCTNAVHAIGDQGGSLEVEVKNAEIDHAETNDFIDLEIGSYVQVSVKDTGVGMPPDVIKRIFDPYFTTKEKGVGTGLGLAVVHGIVKKSGGAIKVESEPGKGTTFHIYLPRVNMTPSIIETQSNPVMGGSERILFVDDEKMLVEIGQQALQHLGYDVVSRTSPIEALELFRAKPDHFDLVITDQTMPGMTGDALAKELIHIKPSIPVIICTGYSQAIDHERAMRRGVKAFVMKPILINEIAAAVRKVLDKE